MRRFKLVHGVVVVAGFMSLVWLAQATLEHRLNPSGFVQVAFDPDRYYVHAGRICTFASENCRDSFKVAPDRYLSD